MKKIVSLTLFSVFLLSAMFIPAGFAAIGVREGDWAKYDVEVEVDVPEEIEEIMAEVEEIEWIKAEVESVSDTTVTAESTTHYENGTEKTETTEDAMESALIIEADLGEGDEITNPFGLEMVVYINGTRSRTYAGASREVNYVEVTMEQHLITEEYPITQTVEAYWDKATGFTCEMSMSLSGEYEGETVEVSYSYKMTETNMWEAEVAPFWMQWWLWTIVAVVIIALAGAVYFLKKRKPPTPTATTLPTEGTEQNTT